MPTLLVPRRRVGKGYRSRSPDSRIILLANAFRAVSLLVAYLLAVVPDHSGASVRELHPLPSSSTSRAATASVITQVPPGVMDVKKILWCLGQRLAYREYHGERSRWVV